MRDPEVESTSTTMRLHRKVNSVVRHRGSLFIPSIRSLGILSVLLSAAVGQNVTDDFCGCAPGTYEFTLDLSLTCPPVNITRNDGIDTTFCQISPFGSAGDNITDLVPVSGVVFLVSR